MDNSDFDRRYYIALSLDVINTEYAYKFGPNNRIMPTLSNDKYSFLLDYLYLNLDDEVSDHVLKEIIHYKQEEYIRVFAFAVRRALARYKAYGGRKNVLLEFVNDAILEKEGISEKTTKPATKILTQGKNYDIEKSILLGCIGKERYDKLRRNGMLFAEALDFVISCYKSFDLELVYLFLAYPEVKNKLGESIAEEIDRHVRRIEIRV